MESALNFGNLFAALPLVTASKSACKPRAAGNRLRRKALSNVREIGLWFFLQQVHRRKNHCRVQMPHCAPPHSGTPLAKAHQNMR